MNFKNAPFFIMLGIALSGWLMYFLKPEKVCDPCPVITQSHTVGIDSVHIVSQATKDSIKLVKPVKKRFDTQENDKRTKDHIPDVAQMVNACPDTNTFERIEKDSISEIKATATVTGNYLIGLTLDKLYLIPHITDSTKQTVTVPKEVSCLQIGTLFGANQTAEIMGLSIGYRAGKNDFSFTYDVINKNYLAGYKRDLRK